MKMKWYISTLIIALTAFGIYQNKISSPNQEILVQFGTDEVSIEQTQTAIASIKQQLHGFGVDIIQVNQSENGTLKIAYYSSINVESIKKMLSKENHLTLDYAEVDHHKNKIPSNKNSKNYNLDIYEIHQGTDGNHGAAGKSLMIVKQDYDRFLNPNVLLPSNDMVVVELDQSVKQAYKVNRAIVIAIENTSRSIPEVRAGPQPFGNL